MDVVLGGPYRCPKCGQMRTSMIGSSPWDYERMGINPYPDIVFCRSVTPDKWETIVKTCKISEIVLNKISNEENKEKIDNLLEKIGEVLKLEWKMMKGYTTIHLWGKGMEKYLGNIMLSRPFQCLTEEKLKEIVNTFPDKHLVCYCTFE